MTLFQHTLKALLCGEKTETWQDIPSYHGLYEISDMGNVRRKKSGRPLKPKQHKNGYLLVELYRNNISSEFLIHRLVLATFVGLPMFDGAQCNHKNGIKGDNKLSNLEWVTSSENLRHSFRELGRSHHGENNVAAKLTYSQVDEILKLLDSGLTQLEIAKQFGVSRATISAIKTGKAWKTQP